VQRKETILLTSRKQIRLAQSRIANLLDSFAKSDNPLERFFADELPCVSKAHFVYCPTVNSETVGISYIFYGKGIVPCIGIITKPSHQKKGWGNNLMEVTLLYARMSNDWLCSVIRNSNSPSINLHLKHGFRLVSRGQVRSWYAVSFNPIGWLYIQLLKLWGIIYHR